MRDVPFEETAIELLRKKPGVAAKLLNLSLKEDTPEELAVVIRHIRAAGYDMSLTLVPEPVKRARAVAAKVAKRPPARRPSARRSAAAAIA